ncbi:hypothetical protein PLICRDRAFT_103041 [Plicaturopsis crispa FD-325 SS-3]|nr:hypothetical protein PLICRDRAFT_103041 [Plicaturopsis crispa FD-325 SS-3]
MAPQTDPAVPTRLLTIQAHSADAFLRRKLRVAGRMLSYDAQTGLALLCDRDIALLVDVSDCLDPYARGSSGRWIREAKSNIVVVGYLESTMVRRTSSYL